MHRLNRKFMNDLLNEVLKPLLVFVHSDRSSCMEIRDNYINVYYRGGNLLRLETRNNSYEPYFDVNYATENERGSILDGLPKQIDDNNDTMKWIERLPSLKSVMDKYLSKRTKEEREAQQFLVRENNFGRISRSTDYYICDIEYQNPKGRFDFVAVHWPSTPSERKNSSNRRLVFGEVKYGDQALVGGSGLHEHIEAVQEFVRKPTQLLDIKKEMVTVFNQKLALGLIDCGKVLGSFGAERPVLLLVLANHDPDKRKMKELMLQLPKTKDIELKVATSSFMGYGLYDPAIFPADEFLSRYGTGL